MLCVMKYVLNISLVSIAGLLLYFGSFDFIHAQGIGLTVAPAIIEDRVDPGETFSGSIRVTNNEGGERTFFILARDISRLSEDGQPVFAEEGEKTEFELSQWVRVQESVLIPAGETREVSYEITIPDKASPGGHFGGIFFSAEAPRLREVGAGIGYRVGTIFNLRISGDTIEEAEIREFVTDRTIYSAANVTFNVTVENTGNVLLRPRGPIDIVNIFGNVVGLARMNDNGAALLPASRRIFTTTWEDEGFLFGRYEAVVALVYGEDGRKTISATNSFWILPVHILVPFIGGALLFILLVYFGTRFYVRRKVAEMHALSQSASKQSVRRERAQVEQSRAPFPKLAVVAIALLVFTLLFLVVLFFFFA